MHTTIFALLAMGAGAAIALQAAANGNFRKSLGDNLVFRSGLNVAIGQKGYEATVSGVGQFNLRVVGGLPSPA